LSLSKCQMLLDSLSKLTVSGDFILFNYTPYESTYPASKIFLSLVQKEFQFFAYFIKLQLSFNQNNWMSSTILLEKMFTVLNKSLLPRPLMAYKVNTLYASKSSSGGINVSRGGVTSPLFSKEVNFLGHNMQFLILLVEASYSKYYFYYCHHLASSLSGVLSKSEAAVAPLSSNAYSDLLRPPLKMQLFDLFQEAHDLLKLLGK
jgi:hypothetical protein